jgi:hypothetical protein
MRIKGETAEELAGFMDAVRPRLLPLAAPSTPVLLPSYNGARKLPNLTALLALLLARDGVPVLVHGPLTDPGRVTSAQVFEALGLPPALSPEAAQAQWAAGQPVFMPLAVLHPALDQLLALRRVLGLRNPGHTLAKLLPAVPGGVRVVNHTHPEYSISLSQFLELTQADALLLRGTEGEPVADARRCPALKVFVQGAQRRARSRPRAARWPSCPTCPPWTRPRPPPPSAPCWPASARCPPPSTASAACCWPCATPPWPRPTPPAGPEPGPCPPGAPMPLPTAPVLHTVHLVGAGPGDPELLTLKALRVLRQATVILVDDLVGEQVLAAALEGLDPAPRIVPVGKRGGCESTPQAFIEKLLVREALAGEKVVRLKGGDR